MTKDRSFWSALKWAYTMNWGQNGFSALFTFVLAGILGPRDFGLVAMAMIYIAFIRMFLEQGMVAAVVQRKDLRPDHLDSVFWFNNVLAAALMGLSLLLAGWWAGVNRTPELALVISVLSIDLPLEGLAIVQRAFMQKEMDFKSLSLRSNLSVLTGGVVGVVMAFRGFGVWSLVGQRLTQDIVALSLLWSLSHWRPGWRFSRRALREILQFSSATFVGGVGTFAHNQADALLIGMFFGPVAVGLYRLAQRLVLLLVDVGTSSLQLVSLSEFSRFQDKPAELRRSVLTCIRLSATITLPAMAGLAMASDLVMRVIGSQWALAAGPLRILCLLGMALGFIMFTGPLLTALSKPLFMSLVTWAATITNVGALVCVSLFLREAPISRQVTGIALARFGVGALLMLPVYVFLLMRHSGVSAREILNAVSPALLSAGLVGGVARLLSTSPLGLRPIPALIVVGGTAGSIGLAAVISLDAQFRRYALDLYARLFRGGEAAIDA